MRTPLALALAAALWVMGCGGEATDHPVHATPEPTSASSAGATSGGAGSTAGGSSVSTGSGASSSSGDGSLGTAAGSTGTSSASTGSTGGTAGPSAPGDFEPVGTVMVATTGVNLRQGPATTNAVVLVVPSGGQVTVFFDGHARDGFFNVSFGGIHGFTYGSYYQLVSVPSTSGTPTVREEALERAEMGMGYAYWWGHGRFDPGGVTPSTVGTCSGSCPSCTHGGGYGGDCSGLLGKAWSLGNTNLTADDHPYATSDFYNAHAAWHDVSRAAVQPGDALVYNIDGAGHTFVYESGDGWGSMWAYECKSCSQGCVHDLRTASTAYKGIGRDGW